MSGSEEETYSIMFSSLKHPARRKILRMLSERTLTFSQMLEELAIPSSHLTYHLENLGELVIKEDNGKYKLSSFGKASVSMMKGAEEVPDAHANRFKALPIRWKTLFGMLAITIILLASFSFLQYSTFSQLSTSFGSLQDEYNKLKTDYDQLKSWSSSATLGMNMLKNVIQLNISKYNQASLEDSTAEGRPDLGGAIEEINKYLLVNDVSRIELTMRFRNGHFSLFQLNQLEGLPNFPPAYSQVQPANPLEAAKALLQRYKSVTSEPYLDDMITLLGYANNRTAEEALGNTKLKVSLYDGNGKVSLQYTANGVDFSAKSVEIVFKDHVVSELTDNWFLFTIGEAQMSTSDVQAIQLAKSYVSNHFSWNANGTEVTDFVILDEPASAVFAPHPRTGDLTLYPYWYVTLHLDHIYPGDVSVIAVGVWADTGEIANIEALTGV